MPIGDVSTEELKKMLTVEQIKGNLQNASSSASKERTASREATRDALWDLGNRFVRAAKEGMNVNILNRVPNSDMDGSVLYDYRAKQTPAPQQPTQNRVVPVLSEREHINPKTGLPTKIEYKTVPEDINTPVQRQVSRPVQPRQVQQVQQQPAQQEIDPTIIQQMINAYSSPDYNESVAYSNPVAGEINQQVSEDVTQQEVQPSGKQSVVADILGKIKEGYNDNRDNGFAIENLQGDPSKSGWNRFGEALGTTARMAGNPLVQGILAGAIKGKTSGDWGEGLEYGINYAQNKAKSDAYEKMMGRRPSILGGYGTDDYKASVDAAYKQGNLEINRQRANDYSRKTDAEIDYKLQMLGIKKEELAHRIANDKEKLKLESRRLGVSEARLKAYVNDLDWKHKNGGKTAKQNADMANQMFKNAMTYINTLPEGEEKDNAYRQAYQKYIDSITFNEDDDLIEED